MSDVHLNEDELVDLALFDLEPARLEGALRHLGACDSCHQRYSQVAVSAERVLAAAPRVAPPPGFSAAALTAMGFDEPRVARPRRRIAVLMAAAALLGLLAGAAGTLVLHAIGEPPALQQAAGTAITTREGQQVGTMARSWYEGEPVYVIAVAGADQDGSYSCVLILADGTRVDGGSWRLPAGSAATWIVPSPDAAVVGMELVADSGRVWATAVLSG